MIFDINREGDLLFGCYSIWNVFPTKEYTAEICNDEDDPMRAIFTKDTIESTHYYISRTRAQATLIELNEKLEPYRADKKKGKRVALLCNKHFFGNNSGIYTFIKHMVRMFNDLGYIVDLIAERNPYDDICDDVLNGNITISFPKDHKYTHSIAKAIEDNEDKAYEEAIVDVDVEYLQRYLVDEYIPNYKPDLIVANSLSTTLCLKNIQEYMDDLNIKSVAYTHIGDVLDPTKKTVFDFHDSSVKRYLDAFNDSNLIIGTQSSKMIEKIDRLLNDRNIEEVLHLPEPYYPPSDIIDYYDEKDGVIIISGNYVRKNYKDMLYYIGKLDIPVTMLCYNPITKESNLYEEMLKNNITKYRVITNLYNKYVPSMILGHRMILHLSHIEVFPYALLEGIGYVPCVINGSSEWGDSFLDEAIKVDVDNEEECLRTIKTVYENYKDYPKVDYDKYMETCKEKWMKFLGDDKDE